MLINKCYVCNNSSYPFFEYLDFFGREISICKCIACGHGQHLVKYSESEMSNLYQQDYADGYIDSSGELYQKRQKQYKLDIDELVNSASPDKPLRVLDYGCSSGNFLSMMPTGWVKYGFEVNPVHLKHIKTNKESITVFDDVDKIKENFDVITLRGVIEHIQNHERLLDFIHLRLNKNGLLFISATPDFSSISGAILKGQWTQIKCPEHIHQFSLTSLSILLARAGVMLKKISYQYMGTPYEDWRVDSKAMYDNVRTYFGENEKQYESRAFPGNMITAIFEKIV